MPNAIEIDDLVVEYATGREVIHALQGLQLTVVEGQVYGFPGPNGAGKTTTMHVLLGFVGARSGVVRSFGQDVRQSIARQRIGYLPEHPDLYRFLTGRELLLMAGRLFMMRGKELKKRAQELLELVGVADAADRRIATYSRGMMQRISMAQALVLHLGLLGILAALGIAFSTRMNYDAAMAMTYLVNLDKDDLQVKIDGAMMLTYRGLLYEGEREIASALKAYQQVLTIFPERVGIKRRVLDLKQSGHGTPPSSRIVENYDCIHALCL